jgi:redox-sensitive bicupin YhaK (pirin superfamily)
MRNVGRRQLLRSAAVLAAGSASACKPETLADDRSTAQVGIAPSYTHETILEDAMMLQLSTHRMTSAFTSASLRPGALAMGHFLNVDHFHMAQPTFPPHPHAGFSAITWMVPWSSGGFVTRDSQGDRSRILPGALHWTLAGSGMLHEEIPEQAGVDCEGLQIFVKLPEAIETMPPAAFHLAPSEVPVIERPGGQIRVLVGSVEGFASPIPSHASTTMLHVDVDGDVEVDVPSGVEAFAVVLRGNGSINRATAQGDVAVSLPAGRVHLGGTGFSVLIAWSDTMVGAPTFAGPFCMFRPERLVAARSAFAAGQMGQLAPSDVRWVR